MTFVTVLTEALLDFLLVWHKVNVLGGDLKLSWEFFHQHHQLAFHFGDTQLRGMEVTRWEETTPRKRGGWQSRGRRKGGKGREGGRVVEETVWGEE